MLIRRPHIKVSVQILSKNTVNRYSLKINERRMRILYRKLYIYSPYIELKEKIF